jgi:DNA polymerase I
MAQVSTGNPPSNQPTIVLIDGHSLAFRSYFAYAKGRDGGLRTSTGIPTSVSYGFFKSLLDTIELEKPEYIAVAFDLSAPTFRHDADETYKEGRPEAPEDFKPDLQNLKELLTALKLPIVTAPGYEADDVIGTLARRASQEGFRVKVLTGDRDMFQLIDEQNQTTVLYLSTTYGKGTPPPREFGFKEVQEKLGILPSQVVDYKALCGDTSDNIPGVKGIGDKTAVQLLTTYGSLENIYASLDEIKGAVKKKLETGEESARHSQYMAQIHLGVPLEVDLADCKLAGFEESAVLPLLEKLEFRSFISKLNKLQQQLGGEVSEPQDSDFSENTGSKFADEDIPIPVDDDGDLWFFSAEETESAQALPEIEIQPQIIDTPQKLEELVDRLKAFTDSDNPVAWDTETNALKPRDADLVGIGCCWGAEPTEVAYIPLGHKSGTNLELTATLDLLRPILESEKFPKVLQNAKFDRLIFRCQGVELRGVVFDTMLASYVLNPDNSHNLGELGLKYLGIMAQSYTDLVPKGKTIDDLEIAPVAVYCGTDAYTTRNLMPKLQAELAAFPKLQELLVDVEIPLEPVLADMEYRGIRIDQEYLKAFSERLEKDLDAIEQQAYSAAGEKFNLGSPKQLSDLLFDKLKLDRRKSRKIKTGYSTDAATLEKLQGDHEVVDAILEYRTLSKLKSTYVDGLPTLINAETQRVHTDFNQAVTTTGRLSSSNPNLQNIPIRTAFSRQIRAAFVPEPGWLLVAADYSQIELRILAHLSQEPVLLETYQNNQDVHTLTAQLLFEKEKVTSEERRLGKVINFGVIYGMGASRFARESGASRSDAQMFINRFNERYPLVFGYLQQMQKEAIAQGYVETIWGRRRYFNFGSDSIRKLRGKKPDEIDLSKVKTRDQFDAQLLRAAANAPIQGSSADIIKIAMVKLDEVLKEYDNAYLLLQVHDELVFEVHPDVWEEIQPKIQSTMESAVSLSVPLKVEVHAGPNWMETK